MKTGSYSREDMMGNTERPEPNPEDVNSLLSIITPDNFHDNITKFKCLIEKGEDINKEHRFWGNFYMISTSPLISAIKLLSNNGLIMKGLKPLILKLIYWIIGHKGYVNQTVTGSGTDQSPLIVLIETLSSSKEKDPDVLKLVEIIIKLTDIDKEFLPTKMKKFPTSPIREAVAAGAAGSILGIEIVKMLLEHGLNVKHKTQVPKTDEEIKKITVARYIWYNLLGKTKKDYEPIAKITDNQGKIDKILPLIDSKIEEMLSVEGDRNSCTR